MKLRITMNGLKPTALEFFVRELELLVYEYPLEIQNALDKFKHDRGIRNRIINYFTQKGINMKLDDFLQGFHLIKDVFFFRYEIEERDDKNGYISATVELTPQYFDLLEQVRALPGGGMAYKRMGMDKKQFKKRWEKIVNKDPYYPETAKVEVIEE